MSEDIGLSAEISIDVSKALTSTDRLTKSLADLGLKLDRIDASIKSSSGGISNVTNNYNKFNTTINNVAKSTKNAGDEIARTNDKLGNARFAIYDVATTYGIVSAALLGTAGAAVKVGAEFETAFANVQRTLDTAGTGASIDSIRQDLVNLSTQIPVTFENITKIATLGNQLDVAAGDLTEFTKTIAEFSTATGISAESTAEAFGKLGNVLKVPVSEFDRLGSSIVLAGKNSAATEEQIISLAKDIGGAANQAGFTADQVVGLGAELASLGLPAEQSRGVLIQYFGELNKAVAEGGDSLKNFSVITGLTTDQLSNLVKTGQGEQVFEKFIAGISSLNNTDTTKALEALNLEGIRADNVITRLSNDLPGLRKNLDTAAQGYGENTELTRQFNIVAQTLGAQFQVLVNSTLALVEQLTGGLIPGLTSSVTAAIDFVNTLRAIADNPAAQQIAKYAIALGVLVGAFAAFKASTLLATVATANFVTAQKALAGTSVAGVLRGIGVQSLFAAGGINAAGIQATIAGGRLGILKTGALGAATGLIKMAGAFVVVSAITDFSGTVKTATDVLYDFLNGVSKVGQALLTVQAFQQFATTRDGGFFVKQLEAIKGAAGDTDKVIRGITNGLASLAPATKKVGKATDDGSGSWSDYSDSTGDAAVNIGDLTGGLEDAGAKIRTLTDYADDLSSIFSRAFSIRFDAGTSLDSVATSFNQIAQGIEDARSEIQGLNADIAGLNSQKGLQEFFLTIAEGYGDTLRASEIRADLAKTNSELADKNADLNKAQRKTDKTLVGTTDNAIENRSAILGIAQSYQEYIRNLAASGASQEELNAAVDASERSFLDQATALGFSRAQLAPYTNSFNDLRVAITNIPRNITVTANVDPALQALNEFVAKAREAATAVNGAFSGSNSSLEKYARGQAILAAIEAARSITANNAEPSARRVRFADRAQQLSDLYNSGSYFKGGYTGAGGKYEPAGVVHKGEYVVQKKDVNQRTGLPYADAFGKLASGFQTNSGYASGGGVGGGGFMLEMTARDRALFGQPQQVHVYIDGREVAASYNSTTLTQNQRAAV